MTREYSASRRDLRAQWREFGRPVQIGADVFCDSAVIMAEIEQTPVDDETWGAKFTVMKENLEHHIEEEEGEMFDKARDIFDRETLASLGERMQARKQQSAA